MSEAPTYDALVTALMEHRRRCYVNRTTPPFALDEERWPGIVRVDELARHHAGRPLDDSTMQDFVWHRLELLLKCSGHPEPGPDIPEAVREWHAPWRMEIVRRPAGLGQLTIAEVAEVIAGLPDPPCPKCDRPNEDENALRDRHCDDCRREATGAYRATMQPLASVVDMIKRGHVAEYVLHEEADREQGYRELSHWARRRFGGERFTLSTWIAMTEWLEFHWHIDRQALPEKSIAEVVWLLKPEWVPPAMRGTGVDDDEPPGDDEDPPGGSPDDAPACGGGGSGQKPTTESRTIRTVNPAVFSLGEPGGCPIIDGDRMKKLTASRHRIFSALLEAPEDGLTLEQLMKASGVDRPDDSLRKLLRKEPGWALVYEMPGGPGNHYKLRSRVFARRNPEN